MHNLSQSLDCSKSAFLSSPDLLKHAYYSLCSHKVVRRCKVYTSQSSVTKTARSCNTTRHPLALNRCKECIPIQHHCRQISLLACSGHQTWLHHGDTPISLPITAHMLQAVLPEHLLISQLLTIFATSWAHSKDR